MMAKGSSNSKSRRPLGPVLGPVLWAVLAGAGLAALPATAGAQAVSRSAVTAASESAVGGLKAQIDRLPLGPRMTVGQYLDAVRGHDFMLATLRRAQLIGGPRELGDAAPGPSGDLPVQVRLDISGRIVADALSQIAAANTRRSPYSPDFVAREAGAWADRTFTATGTSTGLVVAVPAPVPLARAAAAQNSPPPAPADRTSSVRVEDSAPAALSPSAMSPATPSTPAVQIPSAPVPATTLPAAVSPEFVLAARRSAAQGVIDALGNASLGAGKSLGDVLMVDGVADAVGQYMMARPVSRTEVKPDGAVHATVSIDRGSLFTTLRDAAVLRMRVRWPGDEAVRAVVMGLPEQVTGVALPPPAPGTATPSEPARTQALPATVFATDKLPAWFTESMDAGGAAAFAGSKLLTAQAAEADALRLLRRQLESLELGKGLTVGDAAGRDPRIADAVARSVARARVFRVEYHEDGSAGVKVATDPRYLWQDLVAVAESR